MLSHLILLQNTTSRRTVKFNEIHIQHLMHPIRPAYFLGSLDRKRSLHQADPQNLRPRCWELSHILVKPDAKKGRTWISHESPGETAAICGNLLHHFWLKY